MKENYKEIGFKKRILNGSCIEIYLFYKCVYYLAMIGYSLSLKVISKLLKNRNLKRTIHTNLQLQ